MDILFHFQNLYQFQNLVCHASEIAYFMSIQNWLLCLVPSYHKFADTSNVHNFKCARKNVLENCSCKFEKRAFLGKSCWKKLKKLFTNIFRYLKANLTKLRNQTLAVSSSRQFSLYSHSILFVVLTKVRKNFRRMRNEDI